MILHGRYESALALFSLHTLYTFHHDAPPADVWRAAGCAVDCTCECGCLADVCRTTTGRPATPRRTFTHLRTRWTGVGWARHMRSTTSSPPATFTRKVAAPARTLADHRSARRPHGGGHARPPPPQTRRVDGMAPSFWRESPLSPPPADAPPADCPPPSSTPAPATAQQQRQLKFRFDPNLQPVLFPSEDTLTEGTDAWALAKGYVSVTPLRAEYNCVPVAQFGSELHL